MLRLTELKLPLDHTDEDLRAALLKRLRVGADDLVKFTVFRRAADARKPKSIFLIYALDVTLKNEAVVLQQLRGDRNVVRAPDMEYRFATAAFIAATVSMRISAFSSPLSSIRKRCTISGAHASDTERLRRRNDDVFGVKVEAFTRRSAPSLRWRATPAQR